MRFSIGAVALLFAVLCAPLRPGTAHAKSASSTCPQHYPGGDAPVIVNDKLKPQSRVLCFAAFAVVHSGLSRTPLAVSEHLTRDALERARRLERDDEFHPEARLPERERAELADYARSGYDRGHMAPSADMPTVDAQHESFSLANMVPQNPANNRGLWAGIESAVRGWATRNGELYVASGPLFTGGTLTQVGGRVLVPTRLYKAVYAPSQHAGAAYLVDNNASGIYQVVSLAEIERIAGITLFPDVPAAQKTDAIALPKPEAHGGRRGAEAGSGARHAGPRPPAAPSLGWINRLLDMLSELLRLLRH
jgi:endonuclease G